MVLYNARQDDYFNTILEEKLVNKNIDSKERGDVIKYMFFTAIAIFLSSLYLYPAYYISTTTYICNPWIPPICIPIWSCLIFHCYIV